MKTALVLGAGGFISKAVQNELEKLKVPILPIPRTKIDLTKKSSSKKLAKIIKSSDRVFFAAAEAPVKNEKMLINNLLISKTVCELVNKISPNLSNLTSNRLAGMFKFHAVSTKFHLASISESKLRNCIDSLSFNSSSVIINFLFFEESCRFC